MLRGCAGNAAFVVVFEDGEVGVAVRVVIGEDEALLRRGLTLIPESAGFLVAGAAADADRLVKLADAHRPEMVITDVRMPPTHTETG